MLRLLSKAAAPKLLTAVANGIIMSKISYGIELWGMAPNYLVAKLQSIQLEACRIINGRKSVGWSTTTLLKSVNWLPEKKPYQTKYCKALTQDNSWYRTCSPDPTYD